MEQKGARFLLGFMAKLFLEWNKLVDKNIGNGCWLVVIFRRPLL